MDILSEDYFSENEKMVYLFFEIFVLLKLKIKNYKTWK
jgi:hypothetical protein